MHREKPESSRSVSVLHTLYLQAIPDVLHRSQKRLTLSVSRDWPSQTKTLFSTLVECVSDCRLLHTSLIRIWWILHSPFQQRRQNEKRLQALFGEVGTLMMTVLGLSDHFTFAASFIDLVLLGPINFCSGSFCASLHLFKTAQLLHIALIA